MALTRDVQFNQTLSHLNVLFNGCWPRVSIRMRSCQNGLQKIVEPKTDHSQFNCVNLARNVSSVCHKLSRLTANRHRVPENCHAPRKGRHRPNLVRLNSGPEFSSSRVAFEPPSGSQTGSVPKSFTTAKTLIDEVDEPPASRSS